MISRLPASTDSRARERLFKGGAVPFFRLLLSPTGPSEAVGRRTARTSITCAYMVRGIGVEHAMRSAKFGQRHSRWCSTLSLSCHRGVVSLLG